MVYFCSLPFPPLPFQLLATAVVAAANQVAEALGTRTVGWYLAMTPEARTAYNQHRRELYIRQGEAARKRKRDRERYHSLEGDSKKQRNKRRVKLERDRYNKLQKDSLAERNTRRRERASKVQGKASGGGDAAGEAVHSAPHLPDMNVIIVIRADGIKTHE